MNNPLDRPFRLRTGLNVLATALCVDNAATGFHGTAGTIVFSLAATALVGWKARQALVHGTAPAVSPAPREIPQLRAAPPRRQSGSTGEIPISPGYMDADANREAVERRKRQLQDTGAMQALQTDGWADPETTGPFAPRRAF
jgi:hypothetical protein